VLLLYPVLLIGAAVLVALRRDRPGGRGWPWFAAWLLTGALFSFSLVAGFSIGLFFLPVVAAALLGVAWLSPHLREASGLLVGAAVFVVALVAFV
jgi:hypothetical protein